MYFIFFSSAETFARSSTGNKCMGLGSGQGLYFEITARPRYALFLVPEKISAAQNRALRGLHLCTKGFFSQKPAKLLTKIPVSQGYRIYKGIH